ncbi:hypothetical protein [Acinetobacter faecalis]|uniref:hypothetical protein n=1 Tax=Acinetobacter faecalis TaxID=2665161 RepID=UPI002A91BAB1|nr:hypothetical protein [Acinetobacter faecalis]MDY6457911.1 hypothetical protein [Acinetobacter faecalis]
MNFMDFFKAMFLYLIMIYIFLFWIYWNVDVGEQGKKHAQTYLKSTNYKTVVLINDTKLKAVLVSKVKSGYLFVLNENGKNNNKATFISDSAILRID